jgi:DNA-binding LacI/PurR family transcriptional regulator
VTAATRHRVQELAKKHSYVPNIVAATLASSKKQGPMHALKVAVVIAIPPELYSHLEYYGTWGRLRELGYEMQVINLLNERITIRALRNRLYHQGFSGVIFAEVRSLQPELFSADWTPFSVVWSARTYYRPPFDIVRSNPFGAVSMAWEQVRSHGYRRIGMMLCRHDVPMLDDFERECCLRGLQAALPANETAIPPFLGSHCNVPAIKKWLRSANPDAVIGFGSYHAELLCTMGIRMPHDIGYANLHTDRTPQWAGVDNGGWQVMDLCAEHLSQLMRHKRRGAPSHPIEILAALTWKPGKGLPKDPGLGERSA